MLTLNRTKIKSFYLLVLRACSLALLLVFYSCSKNDEVSADLAAQVAGTYRVTILSSSSSGTVTLPGNANEFIIITRQSTNLVTIVNQLSTGSNSFPNVTLTGSGNNISFQQNLADGKISCSIKSATFNYTIVVNTGGNASVTAVKI